MPIMTGVDRHQMSFSSLEDKISVGNKAILKFKGIKTASKGYTKRRLEAVKVTVKTALYESNVVAKSANL